MRNLRLLAVAALLLAPSLALAGASTITTKDAAGATQTFDVITDGSGHFGAMGGVCDGTALAQCAAVKAASTAPAATDPALVVSLSQNAGLGAAATPMQVSLANTGANATAVKVDNSGVTQPISIASAQVASGAFASGAFAVGSGTDGWNATLGSKADAVCGTSTGTCSLIALQKFANAGIVGSIVGGTARIGYVSDDPCTQLTKTNVAIATSSGTVQLVAPSGSTQVYVCSLSLIGAATGVVNLVGGTGATCTTGTPVAAIGSTTAASGMSFAANGGLTLGNGGATVARTTTAGHGLCLIQSGTTALAGNITFVQL